MQHFFNGLAGPALELLQQRSYVIRQHVGLDVGKASQQLWALSPAISEDACAMLKCSLKQQYKGAGAIPQ